MTTQKGEREEALGAAQEIISALEADPGEGLTEAGEIMVKIARALLASSKAEREMREWQPIAGIARDQLPGVHIAWLVGWREHSDETWRREGCAILALHNDGPHGYSAETMKAAMRLLDMHGVEAVTHFQKCPSSPALSLVEGEDEQARPSGSAPISTDTKGTTK